MKRIYLDYAATTPIDKRVAKAMRDFELKSFGNPSSVHREGQIARGQIDFARATVAKFINAKPQEIIFTSGATEANNLAIQGIVNTGPNKPHVVTTELEHHSVYNTIKALEKSGKITATYIRPSSDGVVNAQDVIKAIRKNTVLVSIIFVSNEIGSIQPVREIGKALNLLNPHPSSLRPYFHIDAVQSAKFYNCNVEKLHCDLLTLSAHKLNGPKGIGALYVKSGLKLQNITFGGSQEYGFRPGTQNTSGIIGFAKAIELLGSLETREKLASKLSKIRSKLITQLLRIQGSTLNGNTIDNQAPDIISLNIDGVDQDALTTALDLAGFAVSTGSACVSGSSEPSHVIKALNNVSADAKATIRLSFSTNISATDVNRISTTISQLVTKLQSHV
jgi:cysteine desulfurase